MVAPTRREHTPGPALKMPRMLRAQSEKLGWQPNEAAEMTTTARLWDRRRASDEKNANKMPAYWVSGGGGGGVGAAGGAKGEQDTF